MLLNLFFFLILKKFTFLILLHSMNLSKPYLLF
nr:MAG TPA: hypothetical protein [Caudoviricetes sp.]